MRLVLDDVIDVTVLNCIPQQPPAHGGLYDHLIALHPVAVRFGLYDAADFIDQYLRTEAHHLVGKIHKIEVAALPAIPQQPQVQSSLHDQLVALQIIAERLGLNEGSDYLRGQNDKTLARMARFGN